MAGLVDFKMRREKRSEREGKRQFWIQVTATPQSPDVHEVKIDMYQIDRECYSLYGLGLTPYPLENGHAYTWDLEPGDIVLIIVRYSGLSNHFLWKMAAQGVWMCDGYHFGSGKRLADSFELFDR
jgi:hypothetical protein